MTTRFTERHIEFLRADIAMLEEALRVAEEITDPKERYYQISFASSDLAEARERLADALARQAQLAA